MLQDTIDFEFDVDTFTDSGVRFLWAKDEGQGQNGHNDGQCGPDK